MADPEIDGKRTAGTAGRLLWLETFLLRYRLTCHIVVHAALFTVALLLAYLVRFDIAGHARKTISDWFFGDYVRWLPFFVVGKLMIFWRMKLFRSGWQYASIRDVANIVLAAWLFLLIMFCLMLVCVYVPMWLGRQPIPFIPPYSTGVLLLDFHRDGVPGVHRPGWALGYIARSCVATADQGVQRVLIVGAGNAAETIIREILRMRVERYRVVGLVDDDPTKKGMLIHGVPVLGPCENIRTVCEEMKVQEIIIAMPSATQREPSQGDRALQRNKAEVPVAAGRERPDRRADDRLADPPGGHQRSSGP